MGLRCFLASAQSDPFEPDPVYTGVGKGMERSWECFAFRSPRPGLKQHT